MTSAQVASLREEASILLHQMPEEVLEKAVGMLKGLAGSQGDVPPAVRVEPGFAAGEFVLPDDFDADNELIADLFEGKQ